MTEQREPAVDDVERAWHEIRERLNREHREGIISYRELKAGVNNASLMRDAALAALHPKPASKNRETLCAAVECALATDHVQGSAGCYFAKAVSAAGEGELQAMRQQGQEEGFAAAVHQLRQVGSIKPRDEDAVEAAKRAAEAAKWADSLERSRIAYSADDTALREHSTQEIGDGR